MKSIFTLVFCFSVSSLFAQSFSSPESVEYDAANGTYLVSNRGTVKSIQSVIPGQAPTLFTSNVTSPAGLEILVSKLWVCDGGRMKSYDLTTGALVNNINLGATFLNGVTSDGSQFLFVSDFTAKKIYRINTVTETFNVMVANTVSTPNGMWYDGANNRLIFVNWGASSAIKAVSLIDSTVSTITPTSLGNCDGIGKDAAGNYFVSAWNTQSINKFDNSFVSIGSVVTGLNNPADIYYNTLNDTLAVPNSSNNTVTFHFLGSSLTISENVDDFTLHVYPNPGNSDGTISYTLAESSQVEFIIYGLDGTSILKRTASYQEKGVNSIHLKEDNLPAGEYLYSILTSKGLFRGKFTIL